MPGVAENERAARALADRFSSRSLMLMERAIYEQREKLNHFMGPQYQGLAFDREQLQVELDLLGDAVAVVALAITINIAYRPGQSNTQGEPPRPDEATTTASAS